MATGCASMRRHLSPEEIIERVRYSPDDALQGLVETTMARGDLVINGEGQARRILELNLSDSGSIHRQFFEVQPLDANLYLVFFLENHGSAAQSDFDSFPSSLRKDILGFLNGLPQPTRDQYSPIMIMQKKMTRKMLVYEKEGKSTAMEFTQKVVGLQQSRLYGLFASSGGNFVFFGQEPRQPSRRDFHEADNRFIDLTLKFLEIFADDGVTSEPGDFL